MNWNPIQKVTDSATSLLSVGKEIIDTVFTNAEEKKRAQRKLIEAVQEGRLESAKQHLEELKSNAADRNSAREMYRKTRSWVVPFLSIAFTMGFFGVIFWVLYYGVPDGQSQVTWLLVGTLQSATITILTFFFGRTDTDDQRNQFAHVEGPQTQQPTPSGPGGPPTQITPPQGITANTGVDEVPRAEIDQPNE